MDERINVWVLTGLQNLAFSDEMKGALGIITLLIRFSTRENDTTAILAITTKLRSKINGNLYFNSFLFLSY